MTNIQRLLDIMARLRHPETGCPGPAAGLRSPVPYTLEEAYFCRCGRGGDAADLREELGDLLLQVVFHARIAEERGLFTFEDVAGAIADKSVAIPMWPAIPCSRPTRRDMRTDRPKPPSAGRKAKRSRRKHFERYRPVPALVAAQKPQKRAARFGFDWPEIGPVFDKVREELDELEAARATSDQSRIQKKSAICYSSSSTSLATSKSMPNLRF